MQPQSSFVTCTGAAAPHKIHVLKYPHQKRDGSAPNGATAPALTPVVCVHGLTRMGYDFVDVATKLSETRDVYCFTMAGRGESEWLDDAAQYIYPTYVADCLHIIKDELKYTQIDWLGTSMGGLIGMWVASLDAIHSVPSNDGTTVRAKTLPLVRKLVLNDIGPFLPLSAVQRIAFYAGKALYFASIEEAERHCRAIYADFGIKTDKDWRFFAEKSVKPKQGGGFELHYDTKIAQAFGAVKEDISLWPMYDAISCPTLLLRGVRSDVLTKDVADDMTQRGPKAELVTFENCGHAPALIDAAQIAVIEKFLS